MSNKTLATLLSNLEVDHRGPGSVEDKKERTFLTRWLVFSGTANYRNQFTTASETNSANIAFKILNAEEMQEWIDEEKDRAPSTEDVGQKGKG
jgi:hypothetical protein